MALFGAFLTLFDAFGTVLGLFEFCLELFGTLLRLMTPSKVKWGLATFALRGSWEFRISKFFAVRLFGCLPQILYYFAGGLRTSRPRVDADSKKMHLRCIFFPIFFPYFFPYLKERENFGLKTSDYPMYFLLHNAYIIAYYITSASPPLGP